MGTIGQKRVKRNYWKAIKLKKNRILKIAYLWTKELFWNLFDYVDEKLETNDGCDHSLTFTREFLEKQKVDVESVLDWIINEGGGCDCEVLYNVVGAFWRVLLIVFFYSLNSFLFAGVTIKGL